MAGLRASLAWRAGMLCERGFRGMTNQPTEDKARSAIALILRYGSLASTLVMALGLLLILVRGPRGVPGGDLPILPRMLFARLAHFDPLAITESGILLLLLTPIFRIIVAAVSFGRERNYRYVLISLGVLAVIFGSIVFAMK